MTDVYNIDDLCKIVMRIRLTSYGKSCDVSFSLFNIQRLFKLGFFPYSVTFLVFLFWFLINSFIKAYSLQGEGGEKLGTFPWESK